jgi:protoheme IX farnesyltransferase
MAQAAATSPAAIGFARDVVNLGKPRVTTLVLFTTATGIWLAPSTGAALATTLSFLFATSILVASANTLNCWVERKSDGLMHRTMNRPLPAGRLAPGFALVWGSVLGLLALVLLQLTSNTLTVALGAIALLTYVLIYTPLKKVSPAALYIGAIPGAIPPLMGWTFATGGLDRPGWFLFALLFIWQIPHFIAISVYLEEDYRRGGLQVLPVARGGPAAWRQMILTSAILLALSLAAVPLGIAGSVYLVVAALAGAVFVHGAWQGSKTGTTKAGRRVFLISIIHLVAVVTALILDAN